MAIPNPLRKKAYLGEVVYLDADTKDIIATGHGQFVVCDMAMSVSLTAHASGRFRRILVVMTTSTEGYISPFVTYDQTLLLNMPIEMTYEMSAYLRWPRNTDMLSITRQFSSIDITIKAMHMEDAVTSVLSEDTIVTQLKLPAMAKTLERAQYSNLFVSVLAGFTLRRHNQRSSLAYQSSLDTYMKYHFKRAGATSGFRIGDIGRILLAFKLYWTTYYDLTECAITAIKLGDYITLTLSDDVLHTTSMDGAMSSTVPRVSKNMRAEQLAKMTHFFLNPRKKKTLAASSKVGLAFVRVIDYRYGVKNAMLDMDIASLIFALQSLAEGVAETDIRRQNKATAKQTKQGIQEVLESIKQIEDALPVSVANFYLRPKAAIYSLVARPTFMTSLETALSGLNIDIMPYRSMLKNIDKARRQVVHSEGYDADFLLNLLAHSTVKTKIGNDGLVHSTLVSAKVSEMDKLYLLLKRMIRGYFDRYNQ